jgi:hypothetical protein
VTWQGRPSHGAFVASLQTITIPRDWQSSKQDPKWQEAMIEELEALKKNKIWVLTKLLTEKKAVSCKWIYMVKQNPGGEGRTVYSQIGCKRV